MKPVPTNLTKLLAATGLACAALTAMPASAQSSLDLVLSKPWMKLIMKNRPAAGYFVLKNKGKKAVELVGASSPGCGMLMLHRSIEDKGTMKMVMVDKIDVKGGGSVAFRPGSYHLMCMQPNDKVAPGKTVPVTFKFADGSTLTGQFPVKNATGM